MPLFTGVFEAVVHQFADVLVGEAVEDVLPFTTCDDDPVGAERFESL